MILGNFNIHAENVSGHKISWQTWDYLKWSSVQHPLNLAFALNGKRSGLKVEGVDTAPLSWSDQFVVMFGLVFPTSEVGTCSDGLPLEADGI